MKADSAILRPLDNFLEEVTDTYAHYEFTNDNIPAMNLELICKMFKKVAMGPLIMNIQE